MFLFYASHYVFVFGQQKYNWIEIGSSGLWYIPLLIQASDKNFKFQI